jgi:hypothetical protein
MTRIYTLTQQHTPLTRSRTIAVFRQCVEAIYMVKEQQPQAAKEAAGNVLPGWLDVFNALLNIDPRQDVSGEHWDGLEIRVQIFKVRTLLSVRRILDLVGKNRPSTRYTRPFRASLRRICRATLPLLCATSTRSIQRTSDITLRTARLSQTPPRASRSSCTSSLPLSSTLLRPPHARARLACRSMREL